MICFDLPSCRFNYRVAGIALHEGYVLLHRAESEDFWSLPGGRCEAMERSSATLVREMYEECRQAVTIDRLLWVIESFFTYAGTRFHELGLYYLMLLPEGSPLLDVHAAFYGEEPGVHLLFQWFPLTTIGSLSIQPGFLRTALRDIPASTQHIVQDDMATA